MPSSLRVPEQIAPRVAKLADARHISAHAFMLEAIREKLDAEEAHAAFLAEAERRLARMKKSGKGIPAEEAFDFLTAHARGQQVRRPKARKIS